MQVPRLTLPAPGTSVSLSRGWDNDIVDDLFLPGRITEGDFGGWLRDAMAERRITQRALAMRTGIDHSTISRLLARDRTPSLSTAIAIVKVLGPRPRRADPASFGPSTTPSEHPSAQPAQAGSESSQGRAS
jgi:DNA-binding XRE family transcriptional regulator